MSKLLSSFIIATSLLAFGVAEAAEHEENKTAYEVSAGLEKLNLKDLPDWVSPEEAELRFETIRDKKFLSFEGEKRRIPWLYARDGCHVRATHFIQEADRLGFEKPKRIFIFGELEIRGAVVPYGAVRPWFHAAAIVKVNEKPMVLDPSISFTEPLSLEKWISYTKRGIVNFAICSADTYLPTSNCSNPSLSDMSTLDEETQFFLRFEKNLLNYMGLNFK